MLTVSYIPLAHINIIQRWMTYLLDEQYIQTCQKNHKHIIDVSTWLFGQLTRIKHHTINESNQTTQDKCTEIYFTKTHINE